tara:strand:+ start:472 stop:1017 length:546 start_codon:yes stop_codon:yes gene_type:complete
VVTSHTLKVSIEFRDLDILKIAADRVGAESIGLGTHQIFDAASINGFAIKLDQWAFPIVVNVDDNGETTGEISYDNYGGKWGDLAQLDRLKGAYAVEIARQTAEAQGWYCEDQQDGSIVIYHNAGGTLNVSGEGVVDANGFTGTACHDPAILLSEAMGEVIDKTAKPSFLIAQQELNIADE